MLLSANSALAPKERPFGEPATVPSKPNRRRPSFQFVWGIALLLLAAAAGYLVYRNVDTRRQAAAAGGPALPSIAVSLGDLHSTVRINGTVVAERSAILRAPRIMGSRTDVHRGGAGGGGGRGGDAGGHPDFTLTLLRLAKAGIYVKSGDVVAEFDPENQVQRRDDYQDSVVQLKNSIRKMMANLAASKEAHEQKVRTARAEWQKALLDLKTTPIRSQIDAERLRLIAEETELQHQQLVAEQALVEESQQASIRTSELVLEQSAIELQRAENNVKRMTITAPIDGIVVVGNVVLNGELRQIREGDQVSAGQPFLYVVDASSMALTGTANQVDAERMRLGMRAGVRLDAYPEFQARGTLVGIGAMSKTSAFRAGYVGEIPVRLRIDGSDPRLLPDLTGSAEVVLNSESNVLLAPRPAVFSEDGQSFVFVQDGDGWTRKEIATGLRSATHVAIRSGLQPGQVIALRWPL